MSKTFVKMAGLVVDRDEIIRRESQAVMRLPSLTNGGFSLSAPELN